jgi:hypothetical protein
MFDRSILPADGCFSYLGDGELGGKAAGLAFIKEFLDSRFPQGCFQDLRLDIPRMTVLRTGLFEQFLRYNALTFEELAGLDDEQIALRFQKAELPAAIVGDLLALIADAHAPLAVRSSSLLENALDQPFAGVYATKMIPNNQIDAESRFRKLLEAVKFVYASTYFRRARDYALAAGQALGEERMAVIIQEVVGLRFADRFYPTVSGVARSYTFYPIGYARREEGVVHLALGLGKTIVDGGATWSFSPAHPRTPPPYTSLQQLAQNTQTRYWAVNMGRLAEYDPIRETEYLVQGSLEEAESEGSLAYACSTLDQESDRLNMGLAGRGPRLLDFSPILIGRIAPLAELLQALLALAKERIGGEVELEFALAFDPHGGRPARFGFLQVRPMVMRAASGRVELDSIDPARVVVRSDTVLGAGACEGLRHVVYVKPRQFDLADTPRIARELERINARLLSQRTPYLLIGFGRWGSADPWLGIPVSWSQISAARAIVEGTLPEMSPDPSQGSHFFHNLSSLGIPYFSVAQAEGEGICWTWLDSLPAVEESSLLRHVLSPVDLRILVDGEAGKGVITR